jgi:hypothetical protein
MDDSTEVAKVTLPALLRSLFFQDANLFYIFSMMKRKSLFRPPMEHREPKVFGEGSCAADAGNGGEAVDLSLRNTGRIKRLRLRDIYF